MHEYEYASDITLDWFVQTPEGYPSTGLTVTLTVINPDGTTLISAQAATASTIEPGRYYYSLTQAQTIQIGSYLAKWVSTGTDLTHNYVFNIGYPGGSSYTRAQLRHECARLLDDHVDGKTTSAGTTTTIVDTARGEPDGAFKGWRAYIWGNDATSLFEERIVSASDESDTTLTTKEFSSTTDSGMYYELHKYFTVDDYNDAIRQAYTTIKREARVKIDDDYSLSLTANTYEYTVPRGFDSIYEISVEVYDGYWIPVAANMWKMLPSQRKIKFNQWLVGAYGGQNIRLSGLRYPREPLTEFSPIEIYEPYMIAKTCEILATRKMKSRENDSQGWGAKAQKFAGDAQLARSEIQRMSRMPANSRKVGV